ncbi:MAG: M50 family metallopeptidase [Bacteroidales bacterium]|nr:M50 family metallopeptidase [Bacteroidales bacterium]
MKSLTLFGIPAIYIFVPIALIIPRIPVIGKFFNIINTAIHECGHAVMALIMQGKVHKIELMRDTSGSTVTQCPTTIGNILVSLAGYPFAAFAGWLCCYLNEVGYQKGLVIGLSILMVVMLIFWIRNWYGLIWIILFCSLNGWLLHMNNQQYINIAALFYAIVVMIEVVSSSLILLVLSIKDGNSAGDATNLAKFTHIPAFIWALLFLAFSGWMAYLSAMMVINS